MNIKTFMRKFICTRKFFCRLLFVLFLLSLIPMLMIAQYDHPCADDFSYGIQTVATWRETGSLGQTLATAINVTREFYHSWQGTFSAIFLMSLHPAIFGDSMYALAPIILILSFAIITMLLLMFTLREYFSADKHSSAIIAIVITVLSMQFIPSPVEAFYWYNGAIFYTGFYVLCSLMFLFLMLSMRAAKRHTSIFYALLVIFLALLVGGGNYITALTSLIIMALFFLYRILFKRDKWLIPLLGMLALGASLFISVIAPGNAVRQAGLSSMNPILAIISSFPQAFKFIADVVQLPVYFALLAIMPIIYNVARGSKFSFRLPGLVSALLFSVFASEFTPTLYAMSSFGAGRLLNVHYYSYLLLLLLLGLYWCGWISKKLGTKAEKPESTRAETIELGWVSLCAACFVLGCALVYVFNPNALSGISAGSISSTSALLSGQAKTYHEEYQYRLSLYEDEQQKVIVVPAFSSPPYVLYFDDLTSSDTDWRNIAVAAFYDKDSVALE